MARFIDPASVLDDLEHQTKLELARRGLGQRFDNYINEQIDKAFNDEPLPEHSDVIAQLAHDIQQELSQIWLP